VVPLEKVVEAPKYSEWKQTVPEGAEARAESFKMLFDERDEAKPKEQMHNFLKAYACAVHKIVFIQKIDRFPKLNEIETICPEFVKAEGQKQVVYNLKRRFMQETAFFEERNFGIKGVYLLPKASRFKDKSGRYSDLIFDFENGNVTLPELKTQPFDLPKEPAYGAQKVTDETKLKKEPEKPSRTKSILIFGLIALILITLAFLIFAPPDKPALKGESVMYSISSLKDEGGEFLMFELSNPDKVNVNSIISLPKEIDRMISVEGGTVSISHINDTTIELSTDKDARIKVYTLSIENVPLLITHKFDGNAVPSVYGINNYTVTKINDKVHLNFEFKNSTSVKIRIEQ